MDQITEWRRKYYDIASELEEERGKNQMLTAQLNRDYENSSIPSSKSKNHKKITNSREKTERKPGAQPGHAHHGRKKQTPTKPTVELVPSEEILQDPDFKPTGRFLTKQLTAIKLMLDVTEYTSEMYRNSKTGERYHAPLLFLHDLRVPVTNNLAERLLRAFKRKQAQAVSFRRQDSLDYLCRSMLFMMRDNEDVNVFAKISETFG